MSIDATDRSIIEATQAGLPFVPAPYAAVVMDARTGEILHSRNADTRLHPASLTKMMTLYMAFEAVESGRLSLDQRVKVSRAAAPMAMCAGSHCGAMKNYTMKVALLLAVAVQPSLAQELPLELPDRDPAPRSAITSPSLSPIVAMTSSGLSSSIRSGRSSQSAPRKLIT